MSQPMCSCRITRNMMQSGGVEYYIEFCPLHENAGKLLKACKKAKLFIEYARYELEPGKAVIGDQFPKQVDADEHIASIEAAIAEATKGDSNG